MWHFTGARAGTFTFARAVGCKSRCSHLEGNGMYFVRTVTCPLVDTFRSVCKRRLGQTVDNPSVGIGPSRLEYHVLLTLNRNVC